MLICLQSTQKTVPLSIAHISVIIALWATSTVNSTPSNVFLVLVLVIHCPHTCNSSMLVAPALAAPVLAVPVLEAPVLVAPVLETPVLEAPVP